jgi:D-alanine-D-alanine ligase
MKIAVVYNRVSKEVINLFGTQNREKYGLKTITRIREALKKGGHTVKTFEADKHLVRNLEEFMPSALAGERPGMVFNLSYGIQGRARYTHTPGLLEMLGIPNVGSSPLTHGLALDKVVTKMILLQRGLPTPNYWVLEGPDDPGAEAVIFPVIVKPKDEAVSFGLTIARDPDELRAAVATIHEAFQAPSLVEAYIPGREFNVGLLGNSPPQALSPVELIFGEGPDIYTYEDKTAKSGRTIQKVCPPDLPPARIEELQHLAREAFRSLDCYDSARVDFRMDGDGRFHILEVNSMASLGPGGSYVYAAGIDGMDYAAVVNRLVEVASERYFGQLEEPQALPGVGKVPRQIFDYITSHRGDADREMERWVGMGGRTGDAAGCSAVIRRLDDELRKLGLEPDTELTNDRSTWCWTTPAGLDGGTLIVLPADIPVHGGGLATPFRREPGQYFGEGVGTSRAGIVMLLTALRALRSGRALRRLPIGVITYIDEGHGQRYSGESVAAAAARAGRVLVLDSGGPRGRVLDQRRGYRKLAVQISGRSTRPGNRKQVSPLSWLLGLAPTLLGISDARSRVDVVIQDIEAQRHAQLMPHCVNLILGISYLKVRQADDAEERIQEILDGRAPLLDVRQERLEDRPPLARTKLSAEIVKDFESVAQEWKIPFGKEAGLLASAAGLVPPGIPVISGLAPHAREIFTPSESVNRGALASRTLLLALYLSR